MSARNTLLEILENSPEKQIDLTKLSRELYRRGVLGFGVEPLHVVYALRSKGKVEYDRENEIIYLKPKDGDK